MKPEPKPDDVEMGRRIRLQRMLKGMSQEKLGDACGITFQQIQKYEKGTNRVGYSRMVQIANALGIPITMLVTLEGGSSAAEMHSVRELLMQHASVNDVGAVKLYFDLPPADRRRVQALIEALLPPVREAAE